MPRFSLFVVLVFSATLSAQARLGVPSYTQPGSQDWNTWRAVGPAGLGLMIVNLNNGDDESFDPSVDKAIQQTRKKGIFVVGYTYTGYGTRDLKIVKRKIDAIYRNYLVDGIFFDEVPNNCNDANTYSGTQFLYYEALLNHVRTKAGARLTVLNPGVYSANDCWMSITNILVNWENPGLANYQANYVDYPWTHKYSPDRFWHIIYGVPASDLPKIQALAQERNAGWLYVTDRAGSNPYAVPPTYWKAEAAAIAAQDVQSPFGTAWPQSEDGNGGPMPARTSFRWSAARGAEWQLFLDTDQNSKTGYQDAELTLGADYYLDVTSAGAAHLFRYTGTGTNWSWTEVPANAQIAFPDKGLNLVMLDTKALSGTKALTYQIRTLDATHTQLSTSYAEPFSINNTGMVLDLSNH